jgi:hypothetical protein
MAWIAFYTFAILREPQGHEQVQGFYDRIEAAFAQVEQSEGFIDRERGSDLIEGWGHLPRPDFLMRRSTRALRQRFHCGAT